MRCMLDLRLVITHGQNHFATALVWRQLIEKFALTIEHADSSRAVNLVPSENIEVDIEVAHVNVEVHRALGTIDQHGDCSLVRDFDEFLDRHHGAKDI